MSSVADSRDPDGSMSLYEFLQDYDRTTFTECPTVGPGDLAIWVFSNQRWRHPQSRSPEFIEIWKHPTKSVCNALLTEVFGFHAAQYEKAKKTLQTAGWRDWEGLYKGRPGVRPEYAIVVRLPVASYRPASIIGGLGVSAGFGVGVAAVRHYKNLAQECNLQLQQKNKELNALIRDVGARQGVNDPLERDLTSLRNQLKVEKELNVQENDAITWLWHKVKKEVEDQIEKGGGQDVEKYREFEKLYGEYTGEFKNKLIQQLKALFLEGGNIETKLIKKLPDPWLWNIAATSNMYQRENIGFGHDLWSTLFSLSAITDLDLKREVILENVERRLDAWVEKLNTYVNFRLYEKMKIEQGQKKALRLAAKHDPTTSDQDAQRPEARLEP